MYHLPAGSTYRNVGVRDCMSTICLIVRILNGEIAFVAQVARVVLAERFVRFLASHSCWRVSAVRVEGSAHMASATAGTHRLVPYVSYISWCICLTFRRVLQLASQGCEFHPQPDPSAGAVAHGIAPG